MSSDISFFIDEPNPNKLSLDFPNFVNTISNLIIRSYPKYTVGIFGGWGTGKTTLMNKLKKVIESEEFNCIEFNAWRYSSEVKHATYPLMITIINQLLENEEIIKTIEKNGWKKSLGRIIRSLHGSMNFGVPGIIGGEVGIASLQDKEKPLEKITLSDLREWSKPILLEGIELIQNLLKILPTNKKNEKLKLIIFIDDLDRTTPEKAAEIFESVKIFFDIEGIVFVFGLSHEIVEEAIKIKFEKYNSFDSSDYLKKIIQVPISIPIWTNKDISEYVNDLLENSTHSKYTEFFKENIEIISEGVESNPREVKRLLNNFIIVRQILEKSKINEKRLLILQVLAVRWKKYYEMFLEDASLLKRLQSALSPSTKESILRGFEKIGDRELQKDRIEDPDILEIKKDKNLMQFLKGIGKEIFETSRDELNLYRRASIVEPEIKIVEKNNETVRKNNEMRLEPLTTINPPYVVDDMPFWHSGGNKEKGKKPTSLAHSIEIDVDHSNTINFQYAVPNKMQFLGKEISHTSEVNIHIKIDGQKLGDTNWLGCENDLKKPLVTPIYSITNIPSGTHVLTLQPETSEEYLDNWGGRILFYK